jgi:hypothetical protein
MPSGIELDPVFVQPDLRERQSSRGDFVWREAAYVRHAAEGGMSPVVLVATEFSAGVVVLTVKGPTFDTVLTLSAESALGLSENLAKAANALKVPA